MGATDRVVRDQPVRQDVPIQVVQFQIDAALEREAFPPIPLERTSVTGLKPVDGTILKAYRRTPGA